MAAPQSDIVRFEFNVPQQVSLKFAGPKLIQTKHGERAMFSLKDGRVMFLEPKVAESIAMLELHAGEPFYVAKRRDRDRGDYWDVWVAPDTQAVRAEAVAGIHPAPSPAERAAAAPDLSESAWFANVRAETQQKLVLYHELCNWAKQNLEGISRNEVRAIMMNCLISSERRK
jgi:hypothetical protein